MADNNQAKPTLNAGKKVNISLSKADLERIKLQSEDVDFVSDSRAALLAKTTPKANFILYVLLLFIIVSLTWFYFAELDEVAVGIGKVVPSSQVQIIQNLEGGILSKIFVAEGDVVNKGQVLAQLDKTRFTSLYQEEYAKYLAFLADIDRLHAEVKGENKIIFSPLVAKNRSLVKEETSLFHSRSRLLQQTLQNLKKSYKLILNEINITAPLVKKGVMSRIELLRLQREANEVKIKIDSYQDNFRQEAFDHLTRRNADVLILAESLKALKDQMQRTTIKSPVNGIVKQIYVNTVGGIVRSGMPIMEVVPTNDKLIIEARIKPNDIAFIKKGQDAMVKITAYDYSIYGGLHAKVTNISADTSVDAEGRSYYEVTLKTAKNYLGSRPSSFPIIPGMTASVDIMTGKKSVLHYLLMPILRAKEKALRER